MNVEQIMSKPVFTIAQNVSLDVAHRTMQEHHTHHLVVVEGGEIVGVLSARDLERRRLPIIEDKWFVGDIMSKPAIVAHPETTTAEAVTLMRGMAHGCLPVVDGTELVGIVTTSDLLGLVERAG